MRPCWGRHGLRQTGLSALSAYPELSQQHLLYGSGDDGPQQEGSQMGAVWGAITMILAIAIMNTAILLHSKDAASWRFPLCIWPDIFQCAGRCFSVVLVLGMFSSCCPHDGRSAAVFSISAPGRNRMAAAAVAVFAFLLGMLPFSRLIIEKYILSLVGYMGLIYIGCVACKGLRPLKHTRREQGWEISET